MKVDSGKLGRAAVVGAVIIICVTVLLTFAVIHLSGHKIMKASEYEDSKKITADYGKLFEIQKEVRERSLIKVDDEKLMDGAYRGLVESLDDKFSEYLTKEEAEKFRNTVNSGYKGTVTGKLLKGKKKTGYIRISSFGEDTVKEFAKEVKELEGKGAGALVIDLRGNGGGYADQGIETADMLLPECTITYMVGRDGKKKYYNSDENMIGLKYALIVDGETASASEILAAAVKDNAGGKIIGEKTFGKGVVQKEYDFDDGSMLKLTMYEYFSPKGNKINGKGVAPDVPAEGKKTGKPAPDDPEVKDAVRQLR